MAMRHAGSMEPLARINVTPLVDVMLVLLIIFMVTAPLVARPIVMQLPQRSDRVLPPAAPPPILLQVDASGQLRWDGQVLSLQALPAKLAQVAVDAPEQPPRLLLQANADAQDETVAKILAAARNAGVADIALAH
jgi:biopolymer transport protein ExbD